MCGATSEPSRVLDVAVVEHHCRPVYYYTTTCTVLSPQRRICAQQMHGAGVLVQTEHSICLPDESDFADSSAVQCIFLQPGSWPTIGTTYASCWCAHALHMWLHRWCARALHYLCMLPAGGAFQLCSGPHATGPHSVLAASGSRHAIHCLGASPVQ